MPSSDYPRKDDQGYGAALAGSAAMLMGLLVVVLGAVAILMWSDARHARDEREDGRVLGDAQHGHDGSAASSGTLTSYAGAAPENATALPRRTRHIRRRCLPPRQARSQTYTSR